MRALDGSTILGYGVSLITTSVGILTLTGLLISETVPGEFRITAGVVLLLMGIYRFVVTRTRALQTGRNNE